MYPAKLLASNTTVEDLNDYTQKNYALLSASHTGLLNEHVRINLFQTNKKIDLSEGNKLVFLGNIYAIRKYHFLSYLTSNMEFYKSSSLTDFGVTGMVKWPLMKIQNWSFHLNGRVSSSSQQSGLPLLKNRWNLEHQFGGGAYYDLNHTLQVSFGAYHYRIVNNYNDDNPTKAYINSSGGFAKLKLQF